MVIDPACCGGLIPDRSAKSGKIFQLSIGISCPNAADIASAEAQGPAPGGDNFTNGGPQRGIDPMNVRDCTPDCMAVTGRQIEEMYAMIRNGTSIKIYA
tara:strand:- start:27712 stop:28008 length:297 start_codon:yes stop_codon:yes gene_type:complete